MVINARLVKVFRDIEKSSVALLNLPGTLLKRSSKVIVIAENKDMSSANNLFSL